LGGLLQHLRHWQRGIKGVTNGQGYTSPLPSGLGGLHEHCKLSQLGPG